MTAFVLDASVAIAGLSPDENNAASSDLIERAIIESVAVPALWFYEVANICMLKLQRGLLQPEEHRAMLTDIANLSVECDAGALQDQCEAASALALRHNLTVYDAAYLELALRLKLPLATLDTRLANAARTEGLTILPG